MFLYFNLFSCEYIKTADGRYLSIDIAGELVLAKQRDATNFTIKPTEDEELDAVTISNKEMSLAANVPTMNVGFVNLNATIDPEIVKKSFIFTAMDHNTSTISVKFTHDIKYCMTVEGNYLKLRECRETIDQHFTRTNSLTPTQRSFLVEEKKSNLTENITSNQKLNKKSNLTENNKKSGLLGKIMSLFKSDKKSNLCTGMNACQTSSNQMIDSMIAQSCYEGLLQKNQQCNIPTTIPSIGGNTCNLPTTIPSYGCDGYYNNSCQMPRRKRRCSRC